MKRDVPHHIRLWLPVWLLAALLMVGPAIAQTPSPSDEPARQVDAWSLDTVRDWEAGSLSGLIVTNNAGGEVRLAPDQVEGVYVSLPLTASFPFNAIGAVWRAELPPDTTLLLDVRGRASLPPPEEAFTNDGWSAWFVLNSGDARSLREDGAFAIADVIEFPPDTSYLQLRVRFISESPLASPVLNKITLSYLNTIAGPPTTPSLPRVPASTANTTLTAAPLLVQRSLWNARREGAIPTRATPRGIILHELDVTTGLTETLALLRALTTYQTEVLGWEDLAYHYLIDQNGTLYEGRLGGPTAFVPRLAAGDTAVHVAVINPSEQTPSEAAQNTLVQLLAWLGQAYQLNPLGEHQVVVEGAVQSRPSLAGHNQVAPAAPDPGLPLLELLPELRTRTDQATVRARQYFAVGNVADYVQEFTFLNLGNRETLASITMLPAGATEPLLLELPVPANGRAQARLSDIISDTTSIPAVVTSNQPLIAERMLRTPTDIDATLGQPDLARLWYFAEGNTAESFSTDLVLFNPQPTSTEVGIVYMQPDGSRTTQQALIPARQQLVIAVDDVLPNHQFGVQISSSQPIAAERMMRFGSERGGFHNNAGSAQLSRTWLFAEGSTRSPYQMQMHILNPNQQAATVNVQFMTADGTSLMRRYALPPTTRLSIDVNELIPDSDVATMIEADRPIVAERALYFSPTTAAITGTLAFTDTVLPDTATPLVGTISTGATRGAFSWRFADAPTQGARQQLLLSNPGRGQARVQIEFLLADDSRPVETIVMPPESRATVNVHELHPDQPGLAVIVRATQPIVAERTLMPEPVINEDGTAVGGGGTTVLGVAGE